MRLGDVQLPALRLVLVALALLAFAGILYLTGYKNFYYDEWDFVSQYRPTQPTSIWLPHNEHWSTIPILVWKFLFVVAGIRSHVPYEAAAAAGHVACVLLLFVLVRRRSGDIPAFATALVLLVLGSGGTNIVWAFQIAWVGSIAFGLSAMLLLDADPPFRGRAVLASGALLGSLMCSGVGLAFLAALGVQLLLDPRRRLYLLVLALPVLAFGIWFVVFGAGLAGTPGAPCPTCVPSGFRANFHNGPITLDYLLTLLRFVVAGAQASVAGVIGFTGLGLILLPVVAAVMAWRWNRPGRFKSWHVGMLAGMVAWFTLVGLGRAKIGAVGPPDPHYVYVGAVFVLPLMADLIRDLPWNTWWRPAFIAVVAFALLSNALQLRNLALSQVDLMRTENAELQTALTFRGAPEMAVDRGLDAVIMPQLTARSLFAASSELGSPVPTANLETLRGLPSQAVDLEMVNLFGEALTVNADTSRSTGGLPCNTFDSTAGSTVDIFVHGGQSIALKSAQGGDAWFYLGLMGPPTAEPLHKVALVAGSPEWVHLPDTGSSALWRLRVQTTNVGVVQICGNATLQIYRAGSGIYRAESANGALSPGWSVVADSGASIGRAAKLKGGTSIVSFTNDSFGAWTVPSPGLYDVWYRVKVTNPKGTASEMTLGLWDGTARVWVASRAFAANQVDTDYSWIKAAAGITTLAEHSVQFLATFSTQGGPATLSTDWFIDEAVMVPIGSGVPAT